ncbi:hypothetical protein [Zobellella taiwanensis]
MADEVDEQPKPVVQSAAPQEFNSGDEPLTVRLKRFAEQVIEEAFPDTPAERRLLRPAMIEALAEHKPYSRSEFVEMIPKYLRDATEPKEAHRFLDRILEILECNEVNTEVLR